MPRSAALVAASSSPPRRLSCRQRCRPLAAATSSARAEGSAVARGRMGGQGEREAAVAAQQSVCRYAGLASRQARLMSRLRLLNSCNVQLCYELLLPLPVQPVRSSPRASAAKAHCLGYTWTRQQ